MKKTYIVILILSTILIGCKGKTEDIENWNSGVVGDIVITTPTPTSEPVYIPPIDEPVVTQQPTGIPQVTPESPQEEIPVKDDEIYVGGVRFFPIEKDFVCWEEIYCKLFPTEKSDDCMILHKGDIITSEAISSNGEWIWFKMLETDVFIQTRYCVNLDSINREDELNN